MDHLEFVQKARESGADIEDIFTREIIRRWLDDNDWIFDAFAPCKECQHWKQIRQTDEEQCREKIAEGASCYRTMLREAFAPFLQNSLCGNYPAVSDLQKIVYWHDASGEIPESMTLDMVAAHELGGTKVRLAKERSDRRQTGGNL